MSLGGLFVGFARVGLFGFGGGPSFLPLMQQECVGAGFVTEAEFLQGLAVGNALPGPIATKMAVYVGWHHAGFLGATSALVGLLLPSTLLMGVLGGFVLKYREHPWVAAALKGLQPAIVGMLFFVAWDLAPAGITGFGPALLAVAAFVALYAGLHPAWVVVAAMTVGIAAFRAG